MTTRVEMVELASRLREAAKLEDPVAKSAVALVHLIIEDMKVSLVEANGDDMLRLQGAIRRFLWLYKELTEAPPAISKVGP